MTKLTSYARALPKPKMVAGKSKTPWSLASICTRSCQLIADDATSPKKLKSSKYSPSCLL